MSTHPCRIRNRDNLLSSIYHSTPLFRSLVTALDDGLNRHNPCRCLSCQTQAKRSSSAKLDSPPSKRARRRFPASPTSSATTAPGIIDCCHWCSFPDHYARLTCRECAKRKTQPPMVQHFRVNRPPPANHFTPSLTSPHSTTPSLVPEPTAFHHEQDALQEPYTPLTEEHTDLSTSCDFPYSPGDPSHQPLPHPAHISLPEHPYEPPVPSGDFQYHSPQSTVPDPNDLTDYESICTPESPSMASKSVNHLPKQVYSVHHHQHSTHNTDQEINVDSFMEEVSTEVCDDENALTCVDSARFSLVTSELSDVTCKSVVELGGVVENEHSKDMDDNKSLPDHNDADMFLSEIILSDKQKDSSACNDITDLPLNFLEGMFTSVNEHDES